MSKSTMGSGQDHLLLTNLLLKTKTIANQGMYLKHILIDCVDVPDIRQTSSTSTLYLITDVKGDTILKFLKEIKFHAKI
jgi:hypothetical protein